MRKTSALSALACFLFFFFLHDYFHQTDTSARKPQKDKFTIQGALSHSRSYVALSIRIQNAGYYLQESGPGWHIVDIGEDNDERFLRQQSIKIYEQGPIFRLFDPSDAEDIWVNDEL